jgi:hypothetical protein
MQTRYSLRFESGDRKGETVSIGPGGLTIGRKTGNGLVVNDASVSGSHAKLSLDAEGLSIKDLGSTNGTRVGTTRVTEARLQPGATLYLGNVKFEVLATVDFGAAQASTPGQGELRRQGSTGPLVPEQLQPEQLQPEELQNEELQLEELDLEELDLAKPDAAPARKSDPARETAPARLATPRPAASAAATTGTAASAAAAGFASGESPTDESHSVSAATLARAKKSSKAPLYAVLGLLGVGVGLWFGLGRDKDNPVARNRPVAPLAGNLLPEIWSFEADEELRGADEASDSWLRSPSARRSGNYGVRADASADGWALGRSAGVEVKDGQVLVASATLRARGGAVRLGVEVLRIGPDGEARPGVLAAWSAPHGSDEWTEATVVVRVPPGHARARLVLLAEGGSADADDAGLVVGSPAGAGPAEARMGETLAVLDGACSLHLEEVDRLLFSGLGFLAARDARAPLPLDVEGSLQPTGGELALAPEGGGGIGRLRVENALLAAGGIATIGKDGTRRHSGDFARDGVETLLLGGGNDLVRLRLASPARVEARPEGDGFELQVAWTGAAGFALATEFGAERKAAGDLAHAARNAAKAGERGKAIAAWSRLLDEAPYDAALVEEGGRARSTLVEEGLSELRAVRARFDQALFFKLADMHAREERAALDLARRYEGSEVAEQAAALARELGAARANLLATRAAEERRRLEAVRDVLQSTGAKGLASKVDAAIRGGPPGG